MADLADIYASLGLAPQQTASNPLSSFQNNVLATDPWNIAAQSLGRAQFDMSTWEPATQIGASFGKNFLSALMGQYARNEATEQLNKVVSVLPDLRSDPMNVAVPEGVDPTAFGTLRGNEVLRGIEAKAQGGSDLKDLMKTIFAKSVENGTMTPKQALDAFASGKIPDAMATVPNTPEAKKELGTLAAKKQALDFISSKYSQAHGLTGGEAAFGKLTGLFGVPNDKAASLDAIGDSIVVQVDTALGRELNSDVRNRLLSLAPKWFDDAQTIARKEADAKALVSSLFSPTPTLDAAGSITAPPTDAPPQRYKASDLIAQGYKKTPQGWVK